MGAPPKGGKRKVPAGPKTQPGRVGRAASSRKQAKAVGLDPGKPSWGILHGGNNSPEKLRAKTARLFRNGNRNTPTAQDQLSRKAKRQVQS